MLNFELNPRPQTLTFKGSVLVFHHYSDRPLGQQLGQREVDDFIHAIDIHAIVTTATVVRYHRLELKWRVCILTCDLHWTKPLEINTTQVRKDICVTISHTRHLWNSKAPPGWVKQKTLTFFPVS